MTAAPSADRLTTRDQAAFIAAAFCAVVSVLIWTLWVLPIVRSVEDAEPSAIGGSISVELSSGQTAGVWASGRAASLGTMECVVTGPDGSALLQRAGSALRWDDVLWWVTPRPGFEQRSQFTSVDAGPHLVRCEDPLDTYDGEFLVAGDSFGTGAIGLGRTGASDFGIGEVLVFCAVLCPPLAVLIPLVIVLRRLFTRRRARR
ncbi:hypothetical protein HWD99_16410 [Microbacterium sp. C5A9]|uniref:hypothetical protein n=1 Tax=Microbacterium sp. C5A9 TaxID=2736663 RepID=UPI001F51D040|nr:hypothetical protein [Microbacterium sp. C5A9]MCI1020210.1 hypothetical protein [Microbacterium sp. C5A9]